MTGAARHLAARDGDRVRIPPTATASTTSRARSRSTSSTDGRSAGRVVGASAWRGLRFLEDAFDPAGGRFRNFRAIDGSWLDEVGSEDSHGRAMLALGDTVAGQPDPLLVDAAASLFERALPATREFTFARAQASVILGCDAASSRFVRIRAASDVLEELASPPERTVP